MPEGLIVSDRPVALSMSDAAAATAAAVASYGPFTSQSMQSLHLLFLHFDSLPTGTGRSKLIYHYFYLFFISFLTRTYKIRETLKSVVKDLQPGEQQSLKHETN